MERLEGFVKIAQENGTLVRCDLYNPITKEKISVVVDDHEYPYMEGPCVSRQYPHEVLEKIREMPVDVDMLKQYKFDAGLVVVGATIEVVKGRKYSKGDRGVVTKVYDYKDRYGRWVAEYCLTSNGMKINTANVRLVGELGFI